jgi:MoaA/NifB/PqqE/SkfB family radical SAM enzyme
MQTITQSPQPEHHAPHFLWLDLTRKCQLNCSHCYNASGPDGTHGTMTRDEWIGMLDQAAACDVTAVQLIGGEPTLHPDALDIVAHALDLGMNVEIYSNLVHVTAAWWRLLQRNGASLATSYYSDEPAEHNAVTGRPSHARTRANIEKAVRLGIPLRVGIVATDDAQRVTEARRELEALGVTRVDVDHARPFGRAAHDRTPDPSELCGNCGQGVAAVSPEGDVSPCVFSHWMPVGSVRSASLREILSGSAMATARAVIAGSSLPEAPCVPKMCDPQCGPSCSPACVPRRNCVPTGACVPDYRG